MRRGFSFAADAAGCRGKNFDAATAAGYTAATAATTYAAAGTFKQHGKLFWGNS